MVTLRVAKLSSHTVASPLNLILCYEVLLEFYPPVLYIRPRYGHRHGRQGKLAHTLLHLPQLNFMYVAWILSSCTFRPRYGHRQGSHGIANTCYLSPNLILCYQCLDFTLHQVSLWSPARSPRYSQGCESRGQTFSSITRPTFREI